MTDKSRDCKYQLYIGSDCGPQWPALQRAPGALATEESNGQHSHYGCPADLTTEAFPQQVFEFEFASPLVPLHFLPSPSLEPSVHTGNHPWPPWLRMCMTPA